MGGMVLLACLAAGCSGSYLVRQVAGQVELLSRARPIDEARTGPELPTGYANAFEEIADVLQFATDVGFNVEDAYQTYVDLEGRPLVSVLVACPPDSLAPYLWWFPVVGSFPYKGFFDRRAAHRAERLLQDEGYETYLGQSSAFSSLGWFPDPVYSSFLEEDLADRVDLLLHELTHRTVFVTGETRFNESLAMFLARKGTARFLRERGELQALARYDSHGRDRTRLVSELARCGDELRTAFRSGDRDARLRERKRILGELTERLAQTSFESERYRRYRQLDWSLPLLISFDTYTGDVAALEEQWLASDRDVSRFLGRLQSGEALGPLLPPR